MNLKTAVSAINHAGILLVFPINNKEEPPSLWSEFYPKSEMRWEWDESGDDRVGQLWHLREKLSRSGQVVYTKWFRGRATVFSFDVFVPMLSLLSANHRLSGTAQDALEQLEINSPLSTKQLKRSLGLVGKSNEAEYQRSLKSLWERLLIVGCGEVDEGAFPSLAVGATQVIFEDLWKEARALDQVKALARLQKHPSPQSPFYKFFEKLLKSSAPAARKRKISGEIDFESL